VRTGFLLAIAVAVPSVAPAETVDAALSSALGPAAAATASKKREPWDQPALGASATGDPEILFTFDDGPVPASTGAILDTLKAHGVKAVFFMVGHRVARPNTGPVIQRVLDEGHAVGNHTTSHLDLCLRENRPVLEREIDAAGRLLDEASGMTTVFFRAPYGARCRRLEEALGARGLTHMHWDVDPQEWRDHDAARIVAKITARIGRLADGERAVILAHDTHASTARALPGILDWIVAENARRRAAGRRPIRVLGPSDVIVEKLAPGVSAFLREPLAELVPDLGRLLLAPLTAPAAPAARVAGAPL
jgi:peptidoglycan/xylan/chitin deacetylase (PgdA/CDA1 family)